jgi:hypothetical protein
MVKKLNNSGLSFSAGMKIAFGYERNAINIIQALDQKLTITGHNFRVTSEMICTNGAHYPDAVKLKSIYSLNAV